MKTNAAVLLVVAILLQGCNGQSTAPDEAVEMNGPTPGRVASGAQPNASDVILDDADIYDVSGGDLFTVIPDPFPRDSLVDKWIAVRTSEDLPIQFFRIVGNEHFEQWNTSVFSVDEDLENVGGSYWWFYDGQTTFDIVGSWTEPESPTARDRTDPSEFAPVEP